MTIVTMRHMRSLKLCSGGARGLAETYGLSWDDFLENGIDADILEATGDPFAKRVCDIARAEENNGRQK